jgi:uncharacterized protein (TIGR02265 family)
MVEHVAARIKGSILVSRLKWLRDKGGDALVGKVLARLPADDASRLGGQLLHVVWYPLELNLALDDAIAEELSPGDKRKIFLDMGRASADMNLTGPHKAFVKVGDPHALLSMAPQIYRSYYETGRRTYEKTGPTSGVLRTYEGDETTPADCLTVVGWHQRAIELCGGKDVKVLETRCRSRHDDCCEYRCEWS